MNKPIINGIDVSEYFIDVVDEGGSTIDYKILPNSERLLVEKIFEQNQQLKRLQEENKELKKRQITKNGFICDCEQNAKYKQALENIKLYINQECKNKQCPQTCANCFMGNILTKVNEVLNDRD